MSRSQLIFTTTGTDGSLHSQIVRHRALPELQAAGPTRQAAVARLAARMALELDGVVDEFHRRRCVAPSTMPGPGSPGSPAPGPEVVAVARRPPIGRFCRMIRREGFCRRERALDRAVARWPDRQDRYKVSF